MRTCVTAKLDQRGGASTGPRNGPFQRPVVVKSLSDELVCQAPPIRRCFPILSASRNHCRGTLFPKRGLEARSHLPRRDLTGERQLVTQSETRDARRQRREDLLDEALKETFPASDPPSIARPERHGLPLGNSHVRVRKSDDVWDPLARGQSSASLAHAFHHDWVDMIHRPRAALQSNSP